MNDKFQIFENIILIAQKWQDSADRVIEARVGVTIRQWMLLLVCEEDFRDHLPTISEAAEKFGTSRQNTKRIALELQNKGFLLLANDPEDHRIIRLALTGKHRKFMEGEENLRWQMELINQYFYTIEDEEITSIKNGIKKILMNVKI